MKTKFFFASLLAAAGMLISCNKEMTPSAQNADTLPPMTKAYGDKSPKIIVTVDVSSGCTNPLNAGDYFDEYGEPFFDVVELFSANVHREIIDSTTRPTLYLNERIASLLENGTGTYIRPLQEMGIKVLLSVMGDWQGIGFANLTDTQADQFAAVLAYAVERYGLDGVSLDDEYAGSPVACDDGSRAWNFGTVSGGVTITYDMTQEQ